MGFIDIIYIIFKGIVGNNMFSSWSNFFIGVLVYRIGVMIIGKVNWKFLNCYFLTFSLV